MEILALAIVVVLAVNTPTSVASPSITNIDVDSALDGLQNALKSLQKENDVNKNVIKDLTRQTLMNIFQSEDRIRAEGDSGVVQVRYDRLGTSNYHANTFTGKSFLSVHDHSNGINTCGMGEFIAVLNGVEFTTRHNDYQLVMPSTTSKEWHATEDVPFPPVPPSVLNKPTIAEQIMEMREYFLAFKEQDVSRRDYRPYFKPVLSYLEGAWTISDGGKIEESFASDRHHLDANSWFDMQERIRYTATTGLKDASENFANLPTSIIGINEETGLPIYTQWNYRIMSYPLDQDIPLKYLKFVDDLSVRLPRGWSLDEAAEHRTAHFKFCEYESAAYVKGESLLDKLISKIPGKDNIPDFLTDEAFGNKYYVQSMDNKTEINLGYYNHWFTHSRRGAMGTDAVMRGFADANLYLAYNTQPHNAPLHFSYCTSKHVCRTVDTRISYMIPIEIVYLNPLHLWNPYNLTHWEGRNWKEFPAKAAEFERTGANSLEKAFNGTNFRNYYRTPSEFYDSTFTLDSDPADTVQSGVYVLDQQNVIRRTEASGVYLKTPNIPGVGRVRMRYPIAPIHGHGSPVWKELNAFKDALEKQLGDTFRESATFMLRPSNAMTGGHTHVFVINGDQYRDLMYKGATMEVETSEAYGHTHPLKIRFNVDSNKFEYIECDHMERCFDAHSPELQLVSSSVVKSSKRDF